MCPVIVDRAFLLKTSWDRLELAARGVNSTLIFMATFLNKQNDISKYIKQHGAIFFLFHK